MSRASSVRLGNFARPLAYNHVGEVMRFADLRAGHIGLRQRATYDRETCSWLLKSTGEPIPYTRKATP